jgi:hypothetical protein
MKPILPHCNFQLLRPNDQRQQRVPPDEFGEGDTETILA